MMVIKGKTMMNPFWRRMTHIQNKIAMGFNKMTFSMMVYRTYLDRQFYPNNQRKLNGEPMIRARALEKSYKNRRKKKCGGGLYQC